MGPVGMREYRRVAGLARDVIAKSSHRQRNAKNTEGMERQNSKRKKEKRKNKRKE